MSCTGSLVCNTSGKCTSSCDSTAPSSGCVAPLSKCIGGATGACVECVAASVSTDCPKFNQCINNACMRNQCKDYTDKSNCISDPNCVFANKCLKRKPSNELCKDVEPDRCVIENGCDVKSWGCDSYEKVCNTNDICRSVDTTATCSTAGKCVCTVAVDPTAQITGGKC